MATRTTFRTWLAACEMPDAVPAAMTSYWRTGAPRTQAGAFWPAPNPWLSRRPRRLADAASLIGSLARRTLRR